MMIRNGTVGSTSPPHSIFCMQVNSKTDGDQTDLSRLNYDQEVRNGSQSDFVGILIQITLSSDHHEGSRSSMKFVVYYVESPKPP